MQMNEKNVILQKITDFSWQNMCFLYFVASNWGQQIVILCRTYGAIVWMHASI